MDDRREVTQVITAIPTRRDFCSTACQALSLLAAGALIEACGGGGGGGGTPGPSPAPTLTTIAGTVNGNVISVAVDGAGPLGATGGAALVSAGGASYLVVRTGADQFNALTAICTHQACTINGYRAPTFQCPCHGSQYNTSGEVTRGPATRNLARFATSFSGITLTITV